MSTSPKSSKIMASACSVCTSIWNMDLSIYTPTWHRFGKNFGIPKPARSHPLSCRLQKSDCQSVSIMSFHSWFSKVFWSCFLYFWWHAEWIGWPSIWPIYFQTPTFCNSRHRQGSLHHISNRFFYICRYNRSICTFNRKPDGRIDREVQVRNDFSNICQYPSIVTYCSRLSKSRVSVRRGRFPISFFPQ